ncbi:AAA family ATPase [Actinophytocola sp. NPDC049390]|uniref:AAA family ATPase n=1 Tax=Actinophytocola sp. NPDC049390 TaxID=3363894 RepID=UPI00378C36AA
MLIWLNGPFGGGKTQTAHELSRRLPGSVVCDPEHAGFGLRRMLPRHLRTDFQQLKSWRDGVVEVLDLVLRKHNGPVIAPMTVTNPTYFEETVGRLRDMDHEVHHFSLLARRETVLKRLQGRGLGRAVPFARDTWAESKVDECLSSLSDPTFATHVWTDDLTIPEVADQVAHTAGATLTPDTDTRLRAYVRRVWTTVTHIRLD